MKRPGLGLICIILVILSFIFVIFTGGSIFMVGVSDDYIYSSESLGTQLGTIEISNNYAYILANETGLLVVNITDPTNVSQRTYYTIDHSTDELFVVGNYAFLLDWSGAFTIFNMTNPHIPTIIPDQAIDQLDYVSENYAYQVDEEELTVINTTDLADLKFLSKTSLQSKIRDIFEHNNTIYTVNDDQTLAIIDISDPIYPEDPIYITLGFTASFVEVKDKYAYFTDIGGGFGYVLGNATSFFGPGFLGMVDISDKNSPGEPIYTDIKAQAKSGASVSQIQFDGDFIWIGTTGYLEILRHNTLSSPNLFAFCFSNDIGRSISSIAITDNYTFFTSFYDWNLTIIDKTTFLNYYQRETQVKIFLHSLEQFMVPFGMVILASLYCLAIFLSKETKWFQRGYYWRYYKHNVSFWDSKNLRRLNLIIFYLISFLALYALWDMTDGNLLLFLTQEVNMWNFSLVSILYGLLLFVSLFFIVPYYIVNSEAYPKTLILHYMIFLTIVWGPPILTHIRLLDSFNRLSFVSSFIFTDYSTSILYMYDTYFFLILTSIFGFLSVTVIAGTIKQHQRLKNEHKTRSLRARKAGFLSIIEYLEQKSLGTITSLSEIATGANLSKREVKWLLAFYVTQYPNQGLSPEKTFKITANTLEQLRNILDESFLKKRPENLLLNITRQLRKVALPIEEVKNQLNVKSDLDLFTLIKNEINTHQEVPTRIGEHYITIKNIKYNCVLCKHDYNTSPYWQCLKCSKYLCQTDSEQIRESELENFCCIECGGPLIPLPAKCDYCGSYFIDAEKLEAQMLCTSCGEQLNTIIGESYRKYLIKPSTNIQKILDQREMGKENEKLSKDE